MHIQAYKRKIKTVSTYCTSCINVYCLSLWTCSLEKLKICFLRWFIIPRNYYNKKLFQFFIYLSWLSWLLYNIENPTQNLHGRCKNHMGTFMRCSWRRLPSRNILSHLSYLLCILLIKVSYDLTENIAMSLYSFIDVRTCLIPNHDYCENH